MSFNFAAKNSKSALFASSLLVVYVLMLLVISPPSGPLVDSAYYADIAQNLLHSGSFSANFESTVAPPVFPYVLAGFMAVFGTAWEKAFSVISAVLLMTSFYLLAREFFESKKSLFLTGLFAFIPIIFYLSMELLSDGIFVTFTLLALKFYLKTIKDKQTNVLNVALLSLFSILAILTRTVGLLLPAIFGLHFAISRLMSKELFKIDSKAITLAVFIVICLASFATWSVLVKSQGNQDASSAYLDKITNAPREGQISFSVSDFTKGQVSLNAPISFNLKVPIFIAYLFRLIAFLLIFISPVLVIVCLWYLLKLKTFNQQEILLLIFTLVICAFHVFWPLAFSSRYIAPVAAPILILSALALDKVKNTKIITLAVIAFLLISSAVIFVDVNYRWKDAKNASALFTQSAPYITQTVPLNAKVFVSGLAQSSASYYFKRQAQILNENNPQAANNILVSNYENVKEPTLPTNIIKCREFTQGKYTLKFYSTTCK